ncbi:MAG: DUF72 domain-containing protein [Pseudomonadota bacterium]
MNGVPYRLGLPAWAFPGWRDRFFEDRPSRLASYAHVFNTVEGNTTFYRVPDANSVARWRDALVERDFRFCLKLPREVTHERRPDLQMLDQFLSAIRPLTTHLGPVLVQFPDTVGAADLKRYTPVLDTVAERHRFVVEVRHRDFFTSHDALAETLNTYGAGRVAFDSRPLFEGDLAHPDVRKARHEKPNVPVVDTVFNDLTLIRLILHPDLTSNGPYIADWVERVARCIERDTETYMMIHCPNNQHCPPLARDFHGALNNRLDGTLPELAAWPVPRRQGLLDF